MSEKVQVKLTDFQKKKIAKAVKEGNNVQVRIQNTQLDGPDTLVLDTKQIHKIDQVRAKGGGRDVKITRENLASMKEGGFLQFLIPAAVGLVSSLIGGSGVEGSDLYVKFGDGLFLRRDGRGLYLKRGGKLFDVTDTKIGSGFLSSIMKVIPALAKKILPALGIGVLSGAASEGASQVIKKIASRRGNGLFLHHNNKLFDISKSQQGTGILGKLLSLPEGKIPVLGDIPLLGALF